MKGEMVCITIKQAKEMQEIFNSVVEENECFANDPNIGIEN